MSVISTDEAAIYDRQIRLWGLDAQQRIGKASILIIGICALSNEVCKNLALAGVASITLLDHEEVKEEDLGAQFFLDEDDIGKNRAEASVSSLQALNPRVRVVVDKQNVTQKPDDFFESFDVVCLFRSNYQTMARIDQLRRNVKRPFYAADAFGWFGYIFCDLTEYTFVQNAKNSSGKITHTEHFASLDLSLSKDWSSISPKALRKRISPMALVMHILLRYQKEHHHFPSQAEVAELIENKREYLQQMGITDSSVLDENLLRNVCQMHNTEISPVAAIVGGMLAQDVLRTLSAMELPIQNWFYYNGLDETGMVHQL
ncbi:hypothetical protein RMATCC62417_09858 [Rhizopus microsporus]|nr:hypothetical protein RMATCC62417_09858 [Rhizopus microsporus]